MASAPVLSELVSFLTNELRNNGFDTAGSDSQIVPVILGSNDAAVTFCRTPQEKRLRRSRHSSAHGTRGVRAAALVIDREAFQGYLLPGSLPR